MPKRNLAHDWTLASPGNPGAIPGSTDWAVYTRAHIQSLLDEASSSVEHLSYAYEAMIKHQGWRHLFNKRKQPFASFPEFCAEPKPWGLGYPQAIIDAIIQERMSAERLARASSHMPELIKQMSAEERKLKLSKMGADIKVIERLCADDTEALAIIEKAVQQNDGAELDNKRALKSYSSGYKEDDHKTTFDNVQGSLSDNPNKRNTAPTGNSRQANLRRLRVEEGKGTPGARELRARVLANEISPHAALIQLGIKKKPITVSPNVNKAARTLVRHFNVVELIAAINKVLNEKS